jgi:hypothetical protein
MRAVVGGTVTAIENWSYAGKTGETVNMQTVMILGGRSIDRVAVPLTLGTPDVGDDAYYVADVDIRTRQGKNGQTFHDLSCWARGLYDADGGDPFRITDTPGLSAVNG